MNFSVLYHISMAICSRSNKLRPHTNKHTCKRCCQQFVFELRAVTGEESQCQQNTKPIIDLISFNDNLHLVVIINELDHD